MTNILLRRFGLSKTSEFEKHRRDLGKKQVLQDFLIWKIIQKTVSRGQNEASQVLWTENKLYFYNWYEKY